jgi:hypothetical protein
MPVAGRRCRVLAVRQPIKYFSFWDVPRSFTFEQAGTVYVLTSEFDDDLDEYPDDYEVFVVSGTGNLSVVTDWKSIEPLHKTRVGKVPVATVHFDESRRRFVDTSFLDSVR